MYQSFYTEGWKELCIGMGYSHTCELPREYLLVTTAIHLQEMFKVMTAKSNDDVLGVQEGSRVPETVIVIN